MKLICLILGAGSAPFPVDMNAPNDIVGDLKKAILQEKRNDLAGIDPDRLDLFLARKEEKSGCRTSKTSHLLKKRLAKPIMDRDGAESAGRTTRSVYSFTKKSCPRACPAPAGRRGQDAR
ncbi:hypothetical protein L915_14351 [Phytophthora nicotianae]|uniref:Crinkler effector protein N-terminal domain-containing protein n=1 Tax=Phytophthora nicotianae TaxID=4792 RepID=W2GC23_PHYNI|nr:hypothetical protein L915_14351 [Phytophthora nicotianae]